MSVKFGDVVIYTEGTDPKTKQPAEFNAIVLGERNPSFSYLAEDRKTRKTSDHSGENGEPLLTLAFAKQRVDSFGTPLNVHGTGQTSELVQIRLDVAHESHEYDGEQQAHFEKSRYDGGRWREVGPQSPAPAQPSEAPLTADSLGLTESGDKKEE